MKLTVCLKLQTTPDDAAALLATVERANAAAKAVSEIAWQTRTIGRFALQKVCYHDIRARFDLTAQVVIRLLAGVSDAYKLDRNRKRTFRKHGGIAYDDRILR